MSRVSRAPGRFRFRRPSLTASSVAALALGLFLGAAAHGTDSPLGRVAEILRPVGDLWLAALEALVLPLVVALLLHTVVQTRREAALGRLAGRALLLFAAVLIAGGIVAVVVTPTLLRLHPVGNALEQPSEASVRAARAAAGTDSGSPAEFVKGLVPSNLFRAAIRGEILPLLLFTAFFGLAVSRLPEERREPLARLFEGAAAAMLVCVRWILLVLPAAVFVLAFRFAVGAGGKAWDVLGTYIAIVCAVLLLCAALLYPVTAVLGRTTLGRFARAAAPGQLVAVTTRSSVASLPALVAGGRRWLSLPDSATGLVLPLSVSVFKLDVPVADVVKLLFLAHVYGVAVGAAALAAFLFNVIALSFSTPGLPSAGSFRVVPAYVAAGVPIEGVVILYAVESIPDIFMTLLNVTGDMSAATILSRSSRSARLAGTPVPAAAPGGGEPETAGR